jgi:basic membrane protein A
MKAIKKVVFLVLSFLLAAIILTGCRQSDTEQWTPGNPIDKDNIVIGIIYLDDSTGGWSSAHEQGVIKAIRALGMRDDQIIRKFNAADSVIAEHLIGEAIAEGANIVLAPSWGFMGAAERMAAEHPNVIFANASGYRYNDTNFTNYFGRLYHARYIAGIVAGLKTESNKVGFVAAQDITNSEVTGGINAFAMGVESVNPDAQIYVRVTHSWFDPAGERMGAQRLIEAGCDVIAQHADTASSQIMAAEAGVWGIGSNVDMSVYAPDTVLTSVIWNWDIYYVYLISSIIDGSFTTTPFFGGLADGLVDIAPLNTALTAPGTAEAVAAAKDNIRNNGFNVFDGVMETNDGRFIGVEGATLSDSEILTGINWYYRNVIVLN